MLKILNLTFIFSLQGYMNHVKSIKIYFEDLNIFLKDFTTRLPRIFSRRCSFYSLSIYYVLHVLSALSINT